MSSAQTRLPLRPSGTSPATIRWARPSTIAVLPTPGRRSGRGCSSCAERGPGSRDGPPRPRPMTGSSLPCSASSGEVAAELLERLVRALRILRGDPWEPRTSGAARAARRAGRGQARAAGARPRRTRRRARSSRRRPCRVSCGRARRLAARCCSPRERRLRAQSRLRRPAPSVIGLAPRARPRAGPSCRAARGADARDSSAWRSRRASSWAPATASPLLIVSPSKSISSLSLGVSRCRMAGR